MPYFIIIGYISSSLFGLMTPWSSGVEVLHSPFGKYSNCGVEFVIEILITILDTNKIIRAEFLLNRILYDIITFPTEVVNFIAFYHFLPKLPPKASPQ
jgi:hypothetical protein